MRKSRYTNSQILAILKQAQAGTPVPELCREHGMSSATFYKWRAKYGGMDSSMIARLKELEAENARLKKIVTRVLDQIIGWRGKPACIRLDNGPELISAQMLHWAEQRQITLLHIQPGKPQQNAYVERYNRTVRYDWLAQNIYDELEEVQSDATRWLWIYNNERPNMAIGGITPKQKFNKTHLTNSTQMHC